MMWYPTETTNKEQFNNCLSLVHFKYIIVYFQFTLELSFFSCAIRGLKIIFFCRIMFLLQFFFCNFRFKYMTQYHYY